jgi:hypothetical protein
MLPVTRQHICPFKKSLLPGPQGRRQQRGGLYGWPFWLSTPEDDKTDKKRNAAFALPKRPDFGALPLSVRYG